MESVTDRFALNSWAWASSSDRIEATPSTYDSSTSFEVALGRGLLAPCGSDVLVSATRGRECRADALVDTLSRRAALNPQARQRFSGLAQLGELRTPLEQRKRRVSPPRPTRSHRSRRRRYRS